MESGFSDFFQQLPTTILVLFCGSALFLVVALVWMMNARVNRGRVNYPTSAATGDLPDLDLLLSDVDASQPAQDEPVVPVTRAESAPSPTPPQKQGATVADAAEVMTVYRSLSDGQLMVQFGGRVYRDIREIDAETQQRFKNVVREVARLGADREGQPTPQAADPVNLPPIAPPAMPPVTPKAVPLPGDLPKFSTDDEPLIAKTTGNRKLDLKPVPDLNIADAIETYLQFRLGQIPEYAGRNIHVQESILGGVNILVDDRVFETVDEVDDPAVRSVLKQIIEEWQSRQ